VINCQRDILYLFNLRRFMKSILKLSLAAVAISALVACGGGGSSDATDAYVGTWKSACYSTDSSSGIVYTKRVRTITKASSTLLVGSTILDSVFSDAACANTVGTWNSNGAVITNYALGAKAQFLGANTDAYVATFSDGTSLPGYMVVDGVRLYMADGPNVASATGWGKYSPYIKQ
jgi:hypothetical protein